MFDGNIFHLPWACPASTIEDEWRLRKVYIPTFLTWISHMDLWFCHYWNIGSLLNLVAAWTWIRLLVYKFGCCLDMDLFCCIVLPWLDAFVYWFSFSFLRMDFLDFRCHTYSVLDGHGCMCWSSVRFWLALALQDLLVGHRRRCIYVLSLPSNPNPLSLGEISILMG
jgi:hypothetical protein